MFTRHLMLPIETNLGDEIVTDLSNDDVIYFINIFLSSRLFKIAYGFS